VENVRVEENSLEVGITRSSLECNGDRVTVVLVATHTCACCHDRHPDVALISPGGTPGVAH
jgi:hypothetical protein